MPLLSFAGSPHGGRQRLLPEWNSQPRITPVLILDHSIVGSVDGAFGHFLNNTGIEAHFGIRGRRSSSRDGEIEQWMDTGRQADANLHANDKAISIETEDDGDPDTQPWTSAQLESLVWLHDKLRAVHPGILRREAVDCDGPGLGYHTKMGAPSCWTPVAKTCPGRVRIDQWRTVLLPAFLNPQEVDDVTGAEHDALMATKAGVDDILQALRVIDGGISVNQDTAYQRVYNATVRGPVPPTAEEIAAAVVAALPSGSVDAAVVRAACEQAVRTVFADAATAP